MTKAQNRQFDLINPALVERYRAVIGHAGETKDDVPYGLHWCLCLPHAPMSDLGRDGHPDKGDFFAPKRAT